MVVKKATLAVLVEDSANPSKPDLKAKHGLSFLVNAKTSENEVLLMMDTGPSPEVLLHNAGLMGRNLDKTEVIVISHAHYDHTGGLIGALKRMERGVPVIAHPKIFDPKFKVKPNLKFIGAPFTSSDIEAAGGIPLLVTNPVKIAEGMMVTGEIERKIAFEEVESFWTVDDERFVKDIMPDDQSLILNVEGKGLVVVAGCAHSGIINTIRHAQKMTRTDQIYAVLGGFHLVKADDKRIQATVDEFVKLNLTLVGPCHCSGSKAVNQLAEALGNCVHPLHTGDIIQL